jgi:hypothetical protein
LSKLETGGNTVCDTQEPWKEEYQQFLSRVPGYFTNTSIVSVSSQRMQNQGEKFDADEYVQRAADIIEYFERN